MMLWHEKVALGEVGPRWVEGLEPLEDVVGFCKVNSRSGGILALNEAELVFELVEAVVGVGCKDANAGKGACKRH